MLELAWREGKGYCVAHSVTCCFCGTNCFSGNIFRSTAFPKTRLISKKPPLAFQMKDGEQYICKKCYDFHSGEETDG